MEFKDTTDEKDIYIDMVEKIDNKYINMIEKMDNEKFVKWYYNTLMYKDDLDDIVKQVYNNNFFQEYVDYVPDVKKHVKILRYISPTSSYRIEGHVELEMFQIIDDEKDYYIDKMRKELFSLFKKEKNSLENKKSKQEENTYKNLCVICGEDLGETNPRQYCGKTFCYNENIMDNMDNMDNTE